MISSKLAADGLPHLPERMECPEPGCWGVQGFCPYHSDRPWPAEQADRLTDDAAAAYLAGAYEKANDLLVQAASLAGRPYQRILKGLLLVDRARYQTNAETGDCQCPAFRRRRDGCKHLARAYAAAYESI